MKSSRLSVLEHLLADAEQECGVKLSRDFTTVRSRTSKEGESFLTITLPAFCKAFEQALEKRACTRSTFPGFSYPRNGALPKFLSGLLSRVFDSKTGNLLDEPLIAAIFYIRQITVAFKKAADVCSDKANDLAFEKYVKTDQEVTIAAREIPAALYAQFSRTAGILFSSVFAKMQKTIEKGELRPKHGPGTTAEGLIGNEKYQQTSWHDRLETFFPSSDFLLPSWEYKDELENVTFLAATEEPSVRVVAVPKTHTTPRIIAIEPVCMQYAQQALLEAMIPLLEGRTPSTKGLGILLGYTDQSINQDMALVGSRHENLATIDLSDASDRVSNELALALFSACPLLSDCVQACRSLTAAVPNHGRVVLNKFASMGSAMCFVVESMVFATIAITAAHIEDGKRITPRSVHALLSTREWRVYGDDIIVPTRYALAVIDLLTQFGLKVNRSKTFWKGNFRESCGCDAYNGYRITPVYVRCALPQSLQDSSEVISSIQTRNQFYKAGCWRTARFFDSWLEKCNIPLPIVEETSPVQGRFSFAFAAKPQKMSRDTFTGLVRGVKVRAPLPQNPVDGFRALLKFFLKRGCEPIFNKDHLERSGRPRRVYTKVGWGPAW